MTERSAKPSELIVIADQVLGDVRKMIEEARAGVAAAVNARLTMLFWRIGGRISQEVLGRERAQYGAEIVSALARQLTAEYLTVLPPKEVLQRKLHEAIVRSRLALKDRREAAAEADELVHQATVKKSLTVRQADSPPLTDKKKQGERRKRSADGG